MQAEGAGCRLGVQAECAGFNAVMEEDRLVLALKNRLLLMGLTQTVAPLIQVCNPLTEGAGHLWPDGPEGAA